MLNLIGQFLDLPGRHMAVPRQTTNLLGCMLLGRNLLLTLSLSSRRMPWMSTNLPSKWQILLSKTTRDACMHLTFRCLGCWGFYLCGWLMLQWCSHTGRYLSEWSKEIPSRNFLYQYLAACEVKNYEKYLLLWTIFSISFAIISHLSHTMDLCSIIQLLLYENCTYCTSFTHLLIHERILIYSSARSMCMKQ